MPSSIWITALDRNIDAGEEWANFDTDADGTIDTGAYAELSPNESFTLYYSLNSALGQHENTAVVTGSAAPPAEATDSDDANYYVLRSEECVGVGTPGFWGNNGFTFWDGIALNEKHTGDPNVDGDSDPGFADGELLYAVDSNEDGVAGGAGDVKGLLIGDYNHNGLTDNGLNGTVDLGEDTVFISLRRPAADRRIETAAHRQPGRRHLDAWPRRGRHLAQLSGQWRC